MNPYLFALYAWRETTTMHVTLKKVVMDSSKEEVVSLKGKLSISMVDLLKCLKSLEVNLRGRFICLLVQTFFRTYVSQVPRGSQKDFHQSNFCQNPYPSSTLHQIQTGTEITVSPTIGKIHLQYPEIHCWFRETVTRIC